MPLPEFAKQKIKPTSDQETDFQALHDFLESDKKCFLLKGYAGTGKTTITKTIAEYIKPLKLNPVLLAPTGRAARILSEKTGFVGNTIHRGIYNLRRLMK
ncbi:MAG: AAA family ATPase [Saprospiraceae bacterium]|nr:AAA family ATPase [Saprospiraceae bacterium]